MQKEHLYLHIGTHKTGSTSIQHCLKENRLFLESYGYYYPMEGSYFYSPEASPSLLAHALLGRRPKYIGNTIVDEEKCISDIHRDIERSTSEEVIVSSEHFCLANTIEEIKKIAGVFIGLFKKITVLVYLRRQDTRLESIWSQLVKMGSITKSFDDFLRDHPGWNYFEMLNLWATVFGEENLVVRPFERGQFFNNDLIQDFLHSIGVAANLTDLRTMNESPPVEFLEAVRIFCATIPSYAERQPLLRVLGSLPIKVDGTKFTLFAPEKREAFLNLHRESNRLVARKYLGRSDGLLFYQGERSELPVYQGMNLTRFSEIARQTTLLLAGVNSQLARKVRNQQ